MGEYAEVGILGGSGFYQMPGFADLHEVRIETPFGPPSDAILLGTLGGRRVAFLARHGRGHTISPSEVPARANIWALKSLGVERLISVSAVGSMREEIEPGHLVVPDQLIDRTVSRPGTFFSDGIVAHVAFAEPYCPELRAELAAAGRDAGGTVQDGGTYIVIEGPQFSTRAESLLFRTWGVSVIGMTALPEARLAREAEICYANLALVTDYDCWHQTHASVTVKMVVETLQRNVALARNVVALLAGSLVSQSQGGCSCGRALDRAQMTAASAVPGDVRKRLWPILARVAGSTATE